MALEQSLKEILGMKSGAPKDFEAWQSLAKPPEIYDPPQRARFCLTRFVYCAGKSSLCCLIPPARLCLAPCCQNRFADITQSDVWLEQMLQVPSHQNTPHALKGAWWLQENIAGEGILTFHDAEWVSEATGMKSSKVNWTIDAWNLWGVILTCNGYWTGGGHLLEMSPDGKWIHITFGPGKAAHWIYVIQPGDVFKTPEGEVLDVTPGEDMMRISQDSLDTSSKITFQYLVRRVAYLDDSGKLVKTPNYDKLMKVAKKGSQFCCFDCGDAKLDAIQRTQNYRVATPPAQVTMSESV
ncbi:Stra6 [Symbiodinium pilosum]|uniref:Stra6 protein n=1 Tax=Symbiodinium pilosum TaxID=2952 RepID=A0A812S5J1_SYMPI|nr:Stra6 [Symbiodinium pilosum]